MCPKKRRSDQFPKKQLTSLCCSLHKSDKVCGDGKPIHHLLLGLASWFGWWCWGAFQSWEEKEMQPSISITLVTVIPFSYCLLGFCCLVCWRCWVLFWAENRSWCDLGFKWLRHHWGAQSRGGSHTTMHHYRQYWASRYRQTNYYLSSCTSVFDTYF